MTRFRLIFSPLLRNFSAHQVNETFSFQSVQKCDLLGFSGSNFSPIAFRKYFWPWIHFMHTTTPEESIRRPSKRIRELAEEICDLSMNDFESLAYEIKKKSEEEIAASGAVTCNLKLEKVDPASKVEVIQELRAVVYMGMEEATKVVQTAPTVFLNKVPKVEAVRIMEKLTAAGAIVSIDE